MTATLPTLHRRFRHITARPRLAFAALVGFVLYFVLPSDLRVVTRLLISWNVAALLYLGLILPMMLSASEQSMRRRAAEVDESRFWVLTLASLAAVAAVGAIIAELLTVKGSTMVDGLQHVGLTITAILTAWTFIHVIFTQHYAHEFYIEHHHTAEGKLVRGGGVAFPGEGLPNYVDFLYFSFTIGVASQTADISITSREMRTVVLIHSVLSYFFNTTILALTVNIASSLL